MVSRRPTILALAITLCLVAACAPPTQPTTPPFPTDAPTATSAPVWSTSAQTPSVIDRATGSAPVTQPPPSKYLFVELWTEVDGSGTLPRGFVDFPGYDFDPSTGALRPDRYRTVGFTLAPAAWGVIGRDLNRTWRVGGTASSLSSLGALPQVVGLNIAAGVKNENVNLAQVPVELLAVSDDGTLAIQVNGQTVALPPQHSWSETRSAELKTGEWDGHYSVTSRVTNYGWLDRSRINSGDTR
jgi:hypothetical protein